MGKFAWGERVAYNARLPSGLEVPAVLHPEAEGGGGRIGASRRKSGRKTPSELSGIGIGLETTEVRSLDGYLRLPERDRRLSSVSSAHFLMSDNNCYRTLDLAKRIQSFAFQTPREFHQV